jgi:succinylglutamic semialdehyde dehydrogenase
MQAADLIGGDTLGLSGDGIRSHNPAHPDETVWSGDPVASHLEAAVGAARAALPAWSAWGVERRIAALEAFRDLAADRVEEIGRLICRETGKPLWDSMGEAKLLASKVTITLDDSANSGRARVAPYDVAVTDTRDGRCRFRPHGVMAVIGPYNFPAHLPNGHIVPALLTGNTVVLKPSDKTPAVGQRLGELFREALAGAGAPAGVVNVVQGGADIASGLTTHPGVDGVLFTGSWPVGRRILEANLDTPGRLVALEMGGNNPAVVMDDADLRQAAIECARAAFVTTGQRCTCTRRLVVHEAVAGELIPRIARLASMMLIGDPMEGEGGQPVFMGPIIRGGARDAVLAGQRAWVDAGARVILEATAVDHPSGGHYLSPGIVEVDGFAATADAADPGCDIEHFGPLLRVTRVGSLDEAMAQANATRFGLASAIFTRSEDAIERFLAEARAGCVNVNTGTAGASSKLPFGGLGLSGNHRPAGAFSPDYTAFPVASLVERGDAAGLLPGMRDVE